MALGLLLGTQILAADDVYYCLDDQAIGFSGQEKSYGEVKHYEPQKFKFKLIQISTDQVYFSKKKQKTKLLNYLVNQVSCIKRNKDFKRKHSQKNSMTQKI